MRYMFLLWMAICVDLEAGERISRPGKYEGYSKEAFDGYKRFSQYVPVRDGTRLAVDVYRPTRRGQLTPDRFPVIWHFTPYRRATAGKEGQPVLDGLAKEMVALTRFGYVIALADTRGKGASFGSRIAPHNRIEAEDSFDLMHWLGTQPWSSGKLGMWGSSYTGGTVENAVITGSPYLKAVFFGITDYNMYDGWGRGGIFRYTAGADTPPETDLETAPVDEDRDRSLLKAAVEQHRQNTLFNSLISATPYRDSWSNLSGSYFWDEVGFSNYRAQIAHSKVAAYIYGGWFDFLRRDTVITFANWPNPKKLLIGPWVHGERSGFDIVTEHRRFFDYWLKGVANGVMEEPPIYHYTMNTPPGQEWDFAHEWPPQAERSSWFASPGNVLSTKPPAGEEGVDRFESVYGIQTPVEYLGKLPEMKGASEWDEKGFTYTSAPLSENIAVAGHPMASLWIASTADDADIFIHFESVDSAGNSIYVSDGRLRASLRAEHAPPYDFLDLPWHRSFREDEHKLTPGAPVRLLIDMMPTWTVLRKGTRIRIAITTSEGRINYLQTKPVPTISILRDSLHVSYLSLPIVVKARGNHAK